ncbi:MAG: ImmA/IrrE family metallo-endopeptidase [Oscillospiraceae bacterium]|nr:ImmA/IrrE family metallo-endopeptidase [Oscillospiraceae bacterium]
MNASQALLMSGTRALPVDLTALAEFFGIKVVSYEDVAAIYSKTKEELYRDSRFGFCFCEEGRLVCAINENACGERRRRWTLAHEIGHCLLGHLGAEKPSREQEKEADRFAAELLAPLVVLHFCGVGSAKELAALCGISAQAAGIRFGELCREQKLSAERSRSFRLGQSTKPPAGFIRMKEELSLFAAFEPFVGEYICEKRARRACG